MNQADTKKVGRHFFHVKKEVRENDLPDMLQQMYNHEFTECQHLGPDLTNQIVGVLLRFREEQIAVTGDIEAMYHQVKVPENQRCFLQFFWCKVSDPSKVIIDHEVTAHVFGGISSPSCSNFALKKTATDNVNKYGEEASSILRRNFYVDDMLKSFPSTKIAVDMIHKVRLLCKEGGFNLTKFSCNHIEVLKSIPEEYRRDGVKDKDLNLALLPEDKALGVKWNIQEVTLGFIIEMDDKPTTRRGFLAALSSVYDPFGLGAPFLLKDRLIIQRLCRNNLKWDEPIDDDTAQEWPKWRNNLMTLDGKSIARCLKPENFGNVVSCTLHHFSDACESGYGQFSCIRLLNQRDQVHCTLLIGKSRVAPLKFVSVPRLELTAATLSVKISKMLKNELDIHVDDEIFWTNSKVVLGYINNDVHRFKVFVANRVQQIRDHTRPKQWHYVESNSNPADVSRGLDSKKKDQIKRWFVGPSFLWSRKQCWLEKFQLDEVSDEDPEVRKVVKVNVSNIQSSSMLSRLQEITSSWIKMKRIMVLIMVIKGVWLNRINKVSFLNQLNDSIDTEMIQKAQEKIFLLVQAESFANEIKQLKSEKKMVPESSSISQLDPFLDNRGILRVGGRLRKSNLTGEENHPVILPKKCAVSNMIIHWTHHNVAHRARGMTLNHLRQRGIWIVNANVILRHLIHNYVICRKLRGKMGYQKMADLPQERCTEAAPFTYCGVDMFESLIIKERRSELKRYGALFTCFSSRAVHIEVTNSLDSDSFILALRRFMARRGTARSIQSDNETNFVGARNELQQALKEMKHEELLTRKWSRLDSMA